MSKLRVTIIDYGLGNLLSLQRAFEFIGADAIITREHKLILESTHVILPGVGAFPVAMDSIIKFKLKESLLKVANSNIPLLGICYGLQLLMQHSGGNVHSTGKGEYGFAQILPDTSNVLEPFGRATSPCLPTATILLFSTRTTPFSITS